MKGIGQVTHLLVIVMILVTAKFINGQNRKTIARGECKHNFWASVTTCPIPNATQNMTLDVTLVRNMGWNMCIKGTNYGILADNSHMWVKNGCWGYFTINKIEIVSAATTQATTSGLNTEVSSTEAPFWNSWGYWSACSATCGRGIRQRNRACSTGNNRDCVTLFSYSSNSETCNDFDCPITAIDDNNSAPNNESSFLGECGLANSFRIVGGKAASTCEFPWMVMVYNNRKGTLCGGTIIGRQHVLTAAHCLTSYTTGAAQGVAVDPSDLNILSGTTRMPVGAVVAGVTWSTVEQLYRHENFNDNNLQSDIAIIKLHKSLPENNCHRVICLPDGTKTPQQATDCLSMGWGRDDNGPDGQIQSTLQWVGETVTTDTQCRQRFGVSAASTSFCAVGINAGSCQGDSGGPLVCKEADGRYVQYGIVSGGVDNKCGILEGLYTKVANYLPWIHDKMAQ